MKAVWQGVGGAFKKKSGMCWWNAGENGCSSKAGSEMVFSVFDFQEVEFMGQPQNL